MTRGPRAGAFRAVAVAVATVATVAAAVAPALLAAGCHRDAADPPATATFATRLARASFEALVDGEWAPRRRVDYRYDADGHLVGVDRFGATAAGYVPTGTSLLTYDAGGNLAGLTRTWIDEGRTGGEEWRYSYDQRARLVREEQHVLVDSKVDADWVKAAVFDNRWDDRGRLAGRVGSTLTAAGGELAERVRVDFVYPASGDGLLTGETDSYLEDGAWTQDVAYSLGYEGGALKEVVTQHARGGRWVPGNKFAFRFDAAGALLAITGHRRHEAAAWWQEDEVYEYRYDAAGDPVEVLDSVVRDGRRVVEERVVYTHEAGTIVVPLSFTRTRVHGITSPSLVKFLFVITQ